MYLDQENKSDPLFSILIMSWILFNNRETPDMNKGMLLLNSCICWVDAKPNTQLKISLS